MVRQVKPQRRAFTLVELLIVLAIIAMLIAILLPVLGRARRMAQVLASPIVYRGKDKALYLTDHRGGGDLQVYGRTSFTSGPPACPVCHSPPVWSPTGQMIAFHLEEPAGNFTALLNPSANRVRKWPEGNQIFFVSWADSDHMVQTEMNRLKVDMVGVDTNRIEQTFTSSTTRNTAMFVAPAPPSSPGPYIGTMARSNPQPGPGESSTGVAVLFLRKNFTGGKVVYQTFKLAPPDIEAPRVDLLGENVAWTQRRLDGGGRVVGFKSVRDPMTQEPTLIGDRYPSAYFCDWGEDGNLLCNVLEGGKWSLILFDRRGREVQRLNTTTPPDEGYVATWRKYLHR